MEIIAFILFLPKSLWYEQEAQIVFTRHLYSNNAIIQPREGNDSSHRQIMGTVAMFI